MWEFNVKALKDFVDWIERRQSGGGCAPRDEMPEIREWLASDLPLLIRDCGKRRL